MEVVEDHGRLLHGGGPSREYTQATCGEMSYSQPRRANEAGGPSPITK
jgi:hypothetical protein